jgi:50S ribosomal subunit-associated GTPase HflX
VREVIAEVVGPDRPPPPTLHVLNKLDLIRTEADEARLAALRIEAAPHVAISAKTGDNLASLKQLLQALLAGCVAEPAIPRPEG